MKCIYVLRTGVVVESVRHRTGMILVEGTSLYSNVLKALRGQLVEDYEPKAFGIHCDVKDLAVKIKTLPLELRPKNGMSEDIDEAVARILKDLNAPPPEPGPTLKEKMTVYVARSPEPGAAKPVDNRMKVTINASSQSREDMRAAQEEIANEAAKQTAVEAPVAESVPEPVVPEVIAPVAPVEVVAPEKEPAKTSKRKQKD